MSDDSFRRKIAVMGYPSVGKSSLCIRYAEGHFPEVYDTTIEDTHRKQLTFHGRKYSIEIVDTAGQQEYSLHPRSCIVVDGYLLVYSIDERRSFDVVKAIHDRILDTGDAHMPTVLVGNKTDLSAHRNVSTDEGQQLAKLWRAKFLETSAKENRQVEEIFNAMMTEIELEKGTIKLPAPEEKKCVVM